MSAGRAVGATTGTRPALSALLAGCLGAIAFVLERLHQNFPLFDATSGDPGRFSFWDNASLTCAEWDNLGPAHSSDSPRTRNTGALPPVWGDGSARRDSARRLIPLAGAPPEPWAVTVMAVRRPPLPTRCYGIHRRKAAHRVQERTGPVCQRVERRPAHSHVYRCRALLARDLKRRHWPLGPA